MAKLTYESRKTDYARRWDSIVIKDGDVANANIFAQRIIKGEKQYKAVENETGVPWFFIGALHMRESGCDFKGVLHNGEKIIGARKKTKLVPAGRGPFKTWAAAAIDALGMKNLHGIEWCPARMAFEAERYNGPGYFNRGLRSPYVWAGSQHEQLGKYVADHVWDKNFDDPQIGVMTVISVLCGLRPDINEAMHGQHVSPMSNKQRGTVLGTVLGTGGAAAAGGATYWDQIQPFLDVFSKYGTTVATTLTIAAIVCTVAYVMYEKHLEKREADVLA